MRSCFLSFLLLLAVPCFGAKRVPLIHTTDLYHPPVDPDDHIDLATVFAIEEFDVKAIVLDMLTKPLEGPFQDGEAGREPGFVPVAQLCYLTGRAAPVAMGPLPPLKHPKDAALDRPRREQAGIELLLRTLRESPEPVVITVLGSAKIVTAAFNREPELMRSKVKTILLNAGTSAGPADEYNVKIDPHAYVGLLRSGLPVDWYPCAGRDANFRDPASNTANNTYWEAPHREMFRDVPRPLVTWFTYGLSGNLRGDILRSLKERPAGTLQGLVMGGTRAMWCTASFAIAAGRALVKTHEGWRFVPEESLPAGAVRQTLTLDPISLSVSDDAVTTWTPAPRGSHIRLFRRELGPEHTRAMTDALNALFRELPVE